ncbi:MAG: hypothetical protein ABIZ80_18055, partial [Bryobacteraceae bacterium]
GAGIARIAFGGWELHALMQAQTGSAFGPRVGFDRANLRAGTGDLGQRPDFIGGPGAKLILGDPQNYFNAAVFGLPAAGFYGTLGRNLLTGPGTLVADAALHKTLWQTERHTLKLRVETFNVANHPNFQIPSGLDLFNSSLQRVAIAGRITETSTTSRQVQMALKWTF